MENLILGIHSSKSSKVLDNTKPAADLSEAIMRDVDELGLNAAQIFTHGPQSTRKNAFDKNKLKKLSDINLSVHSPYPAVAIWKAESKSDYRVKMIESQLEVAKDINAWGVVLHIPKKLPDIIAKVMQYLKPIAKKIGVKIILEMVSNKAADDTYETPGKINKLTDMIGVDDSWCWCVDTAHLWGAGEDVTSYDHMKKWLDGIAHPEIICMFHLNGSSARKGSGADKHEVPFGEYDLIWSKIKPKDSGLRAVVEFAIKNKSTIICEINRHKGQSEVMYAMETIKNIADGEYAD